MENILKIKENNQDMLEEAFPEKNTLDFVGSSNDLQELLKITAPLKEPLSDE